MLQEKFFAAAQKMQSHGYFDPCSGVSRVKLVSILAIRFLRTYLKLWYVQIMDDKHIDIRVSHNHPVNKFGHFWSSVGMISAAYPLVFWKGDALRGCFWFFVTHVIRQMGHFFYEHQDRDIEKLKFGHKDASKKLAVAGILTAGLAYHCSGAVFDILSSYGPSLQLTSEEYVSIVAMMTILPHFVEISYQFGWLRGLSWAIKILTDPFTDLADFYTHAIIHPKWFLDFKEQRARYRLNPNTKEARKID